MKSRIIRDMLLNNRSTQVPSKRKWIEDDDDAVVDSLESDTEEREPMRIETTVDRLSEFDVEHLDHWPLYAGSDGRKEWVGCGECNVQWIAPIGEHK
jgi:hypothetical protein